MYSYRKSLTGVQSTAKTFTTMWGPNDIPNKANRVINRKRANNDNFSLAVFWHASERIPARKHTS